MGSLIVPSSVAQKRRAELEQQHPRKGLGRAVHDKDPALEYFERIGMKGPEDKLVDHESGKAYRLNGNRLLVIIYERPEKLKSGIILSDQTRREDEHQGKSALVVMKGWSAFRSDTGFDFGPDNVDVGEWISLWVTDGRKIVINGVLCRIVRDQDVNMVIPAPDVVY